MQRSRPGRSLGTSYGPTYGRAKSSNPIDRREAFANSISPTDDDSVLRVDPALPVESERATSNAPNSKARNPDRKTKDAVPRYEISVIGAIRWLSDIAKTEAARHGYAIEIEYSTGSESTYLHVRRPVVLSTDKKSSHEKTDRLFHWFGLRLSAHVAVYSCSQDYQPLILPRLCDRDVCDAAALKVQEFVCRGGEVVADPSDVRIAIWQKETEAADGTIHRQPDGSFWKWCHSTMSWISVEPDSERERLPASAATHAREHCNLEASSDAARSVAPLRVPRAPLSAEDSAHLRHRLAQQEKWAFEMRLSNTSDRTQEASTPGESG